MYNVHLISLLLQMEPFHEMASFPSDHYILTTMEKTRKYLFWIITKCQISVLNNYQIPPKSNEVD